MYMAFLSDLYASSTHTQELYNLSAEKLIFWIYPRRAGRAGKSINKSALITALKGVTLLDKIEIVS